MKTIALTLFAAALGFAQNSTSTATTPAPVNTTKAAPTAQNKKPAQPAKAPPQQKAKTQAPAPVQTIPAGAKLVEPNLYRFTDSNGKTWNYRQTPFGISKWEETPASAPQPAPAKADEPTVVTDLGDSYRFERKTPFGGTTWVHKKSELSDEEKALTQSSQPNVNSRPAGNQ